MNSRWTSGLSITQQRSENSDNSLRFIRQKIIQRKTLPHSAISRLNSFLTRLKNFLILELLRLSNLFSQQIQTHCYDVLNIPFLMNHKRPHRLWLIDLGVLKWPQIDPEFDHLLLKIYLESNSRYSANEIFGYPRLKCRFSGYLNFLICQMKCYFSCFRILRFKKRDLFWPHFIKKRTCSSLTEHTYFFLAWCSPSLLLRIS